MNMIILVMGEIFFTLVIGGAFWTLAYFSLVGASKLMLWASLKFPKSSASGFLVTLGLCILFGIILRVLFSFLH